ncbi:MAG: hypothetical protein ACAF42_14495 [Limnothrix sp. BL-A-16]
MKRSSLQFRPQTRQSLRSRSPDGAILIPVDRVWRWTLPTNRS